MRYFFILLIFLVNLIACKDDDIIECAPLNNNPILCESVVPFNTHIDSCIDIPAPTLQYIPFPRDTNSYSPNYHPSNPTQFVFTQSADNINSYTADLCDGTYQYLFLGNYDHGPRWGRNGWITFPRANNIWKIKEDGDSLTQITFSDYNYRGSEWVGENSDTLISGIFFSNQGMTKTIFLTLNGTIIDTLPFYLFRPHYKNHKIAGFKSPELGYIELPSYEFKPLIELGSMNDEAPNHIQWLDGENITWLDRDGLHRININTLDQELLKEDCDNYSLRNFSASPAGNGDMLITYNPRELIGHDSMAVQQDILLFNAYSKEQWIVELDPD